MPRQALAALLVLRFHDIVMRGAVFAHTTAFAVNLLDDLRLYDDGPEKISDPGQN